MSDSLAHEINQQITLLTPVQQQDVLSFIYSINASTAKPSKGTRGKELLKFVGSISPEDLELMKFAIKEGCEQVDPDGWS